MTTAKLINDRFGIMCRSLDNPVTNSVGTSATEILDNNPNRVGYAIVNLSANDLYVAYDRGVGATHGIYLAPNGGSMTVNVTDDFDAVCNKVFALAGGAASAIYVHTVVIDKES